MPTDFVRAKDAVAVLTNRRGLLWISCSPLRPPSTAYRRGHEDATTAWMACSPGAGAARADAGSSAGRGHSFEDERAFCARLVDDLPGGRKPRAGGGVHQHRRIRCGLAVPKRPAPGPASHCSTSSASPTTTRATSCHSWPSTGGPPAPPTSRSRSIAASRRPSQSDRAADDLHTDAGRGLGPRGSCPCVGDWNPRDGGNAQVTTTWTGRVTLSTPRRTASSTCRRTLPSSTTTGRFWASATGVPAGGTGCPGGRAAPPPRAGRRVRRPHPAGSTPACLPPPPP